MTQDKKDDRRPGRDGDRMKKKSESSSSSVVKETKEKTDTDFLPTKIVIRRLPPSWTAEMLMEQISPVPDNDYFYFVPADLSLGQNAFSRAYLNLLNRQDISIFMEKFDGYIFVDSKGLEYPAIVEFAPFLKVPKRRPKKADPRKGTIDTDADYLKFLSQLQNTETEPIPTPDTFLEEIEAREKQHKEHVLVSTPLIEFMVRRREEKKLAIVQAQQAREDKRRKELERRKREEEMRQLERERLREKERQKQREKEERARRKEEAPPSTAATAPSQTPVKLLKNSERAKDQEQHKEKYDVTKTSGTGRPKQTESARTVTREPDSSDRRDRDRPREAPSRQSTDSRQSSQRYGKVPDEDDDRSHQPSRHRGAPPASRNRPDRYEPLPKQTSSDKTANKAKDPAEQPKLAKDEQPGKPKSEETESQKVSDGAARSVAEDKAERDAKPKSSQSLRDDRRQRASEDSRGGGGREYREGRYPKDKRDGRYDGKEYKERRDDRDYRDRDVRDRDRRDERDQKPSRPESKAGSQRESGSKSQAASRRDDGTAGKAKTSDEGRTANAGGGHNEARRNSKELSEPEAGSRVGKEKTPDRSGHESSPAPSRAEGRRETDRRSSEKDLKDTHHGAGGPNRQRIRYKDRPERAIYNPAARRAVDRKKEDNPSTDDVQDDK